MAFIVDQGLITWIGPINKIPKQKINSEIDLKNKLVFPSFIECHTHSVFAGTRSDEFERRLQGTSYIDIAKAGGGILSTMKKTREASEAVLLKTAKSRIDQFVKQGVSTIEIKSGYALDLKNEIKMLKVIQKIPNLYNVKNGRPRIVPTYLGAHAKPPEFSGYSEYLNYILKNVLPVVKKKKLSDRVDIFIEKNFFESADSQNFLSAAKKMGFQITIHANQLSESGGAELALSLSAQSADHVICLSDKTIADFGRSKTVAVLLPLADLYMRCPYPQARKLIDAGATVALATDFNPGSCPSQDLSLVGLLARLEMRMTLPEIFKAYTINAAKALGIDQEEGTLAVGKKANFICTDADLSDFFYSAGYTPEHQLFIEGKPVKM